MKYQIFRLCLPITMMAMMATAVLTSCEKEAPQTKDADALTRTTEDSLKQEGINIVIHDEWDGETEYKF